MKNYRFFTKQSKSPFWAIFEVRAHSKIFDTGFQKKTSKDRISKVEFFKVEFLANCILNLGLAKFESPTVFTVKKGESKNFQFYVCKILNPDMKFFIFNIFFSEYSILKHFKTLKLVVPRTLKKILLLITCTLC